MPLKKNHLNTYYHSILLLTREKKRLFGESLPDNNVLRLTAKANYKNLVDYSVEFAKNLEIFQRYAKIS